MVININNNNDSNNNNIFNNSIISNNNNNNNVMLVVVMVIIVIILLVVLTILVRVIIKVIRIIIVSQNHTPQESVLCANDAVCELRSVENSWARPSLQQLSGLLKHVWALGRIPIKNI